MALSPAVMEGVLIYVYPPAAVPAVAVTAAVVAVIAKAVDAIAGLFIAPIPTLVAVSHAVTSPELSFIHTEIAVSKDAADEIMS